MHSPSLRRFIRTCCWRLCEHRLDGEGEGAVVDDAFAENIEAAERDLGDAGDENAQLELVPDDISHSHAGGGAIASEIQRFQRGSLLPSDMPNIWSGSVAPALREEQRQDRVIKQQTE